MNERDEIAAAAANLASAIARRDEPGLRMLLAPGFTQRTLGGESVEGEGFLRAIAQIPGEIQFVRLEECQVDVLPSGALVTGTQHAQVMIDGQIVDDRRRYVDWFIKDGGVWRIQAAVDVP